MKIMTRKDLDAILLEGCAEPECKHHHEPLSEIFINPLCCTGGGLDVCYNADGFLKITCVRCNAEVAQVKVGD